MDLSYSQAIIELDHLTLSLYFYLYRQGIHTHTHTHIHTAKTKTKTKTKPEKTKRTRDEHFSNKIKSHTKVNVALGYHSYLLLPT